MKRSPLHWAAVLGLLPSHYLGILRPLYFNQGKSDNAQVCFPCWSPCDVCVTSFYAGNFIATVLIGCFIVGAGDSKCELLYTFPWTSLTENLSQNKVVTHTVLFFPGKDGLVPCSIYPKFYVSLPGVFQQKCPNNHRGNEHRH